MTERLQHTVQHHLNAVHVYCRLCDFMPPGTAAKVSRAWEKLVHPIIYRKCSAGPLVQGASRIR